jgi:hypothetical protein
VQVHGTDERVIVRVDQQRRVRSAGCGAGVGFAAGFIELGEELSQDRLSGLGGLIANVAFVVSEDSDPVRVAQGDDIGALANGYFAGLERVMFFSGFLGSG